MDKTVPFSVWIFIPAKTNEMNVCFYTIGRIFDMYTLHYEGNRTEKFWILHHIKWFSSLTQICLFPWGKLLEFWNGGAKVEQFVQHHQTFMNKTSSNIREQRLKQRVLLH